MARTARVAGAINRYFESLFDTEADAIKTRDIRDLLWKLKGKKKPRTINQPRRILYAIFNLGINNDLISNKPVKKSLYFQSTTPQNISRQKKISLKY